MSKSLIVAGLMILSPLAALHAQNTTTKYQNRSKADQTFNANENMFSLRDFVVLKQGRMILELSDPRDYESVRNLDSILSQVSKDIAFYKDSLSADPTAGVRVDYAVTEDYPFKKIRFTKHSGTGNIYLDQGGDMSRLKFEQDTVRIIMQKSKPGLGRKKTAPCMISYAVQATFILGNYYDIDKIVAEHALKNIVDTMEKAAQTKKTINNPYANPMTIFYNPYFNHKSNFTVLRWLADGPDDIFTPAEHRNSLSLNAGIGAGLVRNAIAPEAEIGIQYAKHTRWNHKNFDFFRIYAAPYFLFDKDAKGNYLVNDNWFINADLGSVYDGNERTWLGKRVSFGIGYLAVNKGGYFKNTTMKVFTDLEVTKRFTIVPELIATNNFKQIFPGITVKVF